MLFNRFSNFTSLPVKTAEQRANFLKQIEDFTAEIQAAKLCTPPAANVAPQAVAAPAATGQGACAFLIADKQAQAAHSKGASATVCAASAKRIPDGNHGDNNNTQLTS